MNRGLLGLLVGLVGAVGAMWAARRFFGSAEDEALPGTGMADGGAVGTAGSEAGGAAGGAPRREGLDPTLLEILACPDDKAPVIYQKEGDAERLTCTKCGKRYPVRDGIPVMLIDEAAPGPVPTEAEITAARALIPEGKPALVGATAPSAPSAAPATPSPSGPPPTPPAGPAGLAGSTGPTPPPAPAE